MAVYGGQRDIPYHARCRILPTVRAPFMNSPALPPPEFDDPMTRMTQSRAFLAFDGTVDYDDMHGAVRLLGLDSLWIHGMLSPFSLLFVLHRCAKH